eukprot:75520_1
MTFPSLDFQSVRFWNYASMTVVLWFIYIPIVIYYAYKYYTLRHHIVLQKRYCQITLFEILFVFCKFVWYPIALTAESIVGDTSFIASLFWSFNNYFAYLSLYCFVWRFYMLWFDIKWMNNIINSQWKLIINPSYQQKRSDHWFVKKKATFGNYKWMKYKVFAIAIISGTLTNIAGLWNSYNNSDKPIVFDIIELITITLLLIPFILLIIIYYKMYQSKFQDNFHIMNEMRYIFIAFCIQGVSWNGFYVFLIVTKPSFFVYQVTTFIASYCIVTAEFIAIIISTCYVLKKVKLIINEHRYKTHYINPSNHNDAMRFLPLTESEEKHELLDIVPPKIDLDAPVDENWTLFSILSHTQCFQCFIQHLSREFSIECLLSFVEFIQFEAYILEHKNIDSVNGDTVNRLCDEVTFSKDIPKSKIVYGENINDNSILDLCRIICEKLYDKYIKIEAEYETNVSSRLRQKFEVMINDETIFTVDVLLENINSFCKLQMNLLNSSFYRFTSSPEFQKLKNFIFIQK